MPLALGWAPCRAPGAAGSSAGCWAGQWHRADHDTASLCSSGGQQSFPEWAQPEPLVWGWPKGHHCLPAPRAGVSKHRALCSLLAQPCLWLHGAGTMTPGCSSKLFKLWEPSREAAPETNSWTEVWPGLTPAQSLRGHISLSRVSLLNTLAGQGVTDQVKYQTFVSGWQILKCVLSQWKEF